jgi:hypothetical protein
MRREMIRGCLLYLCSGAGVFSPVSRALGREENLIRVGLLCQYLAQPECVHAMTHGPPPDLTLYLPYEYKVYA